MDTIVRVIQDLSKVRTLPEIINIVRSAARQITGADGATFVLRDNGYCFYADEDAIGPLWKGKRFPLTACVSGWAMLNKKCVAIPDIFKDPRIPIEAYKPTFVKSLAMVPIRQEDPIGAIGNYWATEHLATEQELNVLQALADTTSVAIENVVLLNSLEDRVRELENANHLKDEFLMMVSHELRTPLNSILGWSEILIQDESDKSSPHYAGLSAIYRNSKAQLRVIDNLLDASSIVLGQFDVDKKEVDFIPVLKKVLEHFKQVASSKSIEVQSRIPLSRAVLNGDAERLKEVVEILLDNAIKFSSEGSAVQVEVLTEGPSLTLRINDSGEGLDPATIPSLFNRFSQQEHYIRRSHGGLGLGLTIAKSIVEAHQGQITAISEGLGQGAEFSVSFPLITSERRSSTINEKNSPDEVVDVSRFN